MLAANKVQKYIKSHIKHLMRQGLQTPDYKIRKQLSRHARENLVAELQIPKNMTIA